MYIFFASIYIRANNTPTRRTNIERTPYIYLCCDRIAQGLLPKLLQILMNVQACLCLFSLDHIAWYVCVMRYIGRFSLRASIRVGPQVEGWTGNGGGEPRCKIRQAVIHPRPTVFGYNHPFYSPFSFVLFSPFCREARPRARHKKGAIKRPRCGNEKIEINVRDVPVDRERSQIHYFITTLRARFSIRFRAGIWDMNIFLLFWQMFENFTDRRCVFAHRSVRATVLHRRYR